MSSNNVSSSLLIVPYQLNIYLGCFIYVSGVVGSIGNLLVYRSSSCRRRATFIYLFWESVVDLVYLNSVLLTRILMKGFQIPITGRYEVFCKIRQFASSYGNQLAVTFLALATIDRLLLAQRSVVYRQWGNRVSLVNKLAITSAFAWIGILCHRLIWYQVSNGQCGPQPGFYAYFDNLFDAIVTCLLPMIILSVLGILIGRSTRRVIGGRVFTLTNSNRSLNITRPVIRKIDEQLTLMLFLQITVSMISFLPFAAHLLYINITNDWPKSHLRVAWETVMIEFIRILSYLFFSCPFYVAILSISGFRRQFLHACRIMNQPANIHLHAQDPIPVINFSVSNGIRIHPRPAS